MPRKYITVREKALKKEPELMPKFNVFHDCLKINEKGEITLPLQREHDLTGFGHLQIHEKSFQSLKKTDARKRHAKSMVNEAKKNGK